MASGAIPAPFLFLAALTATKVTESVASECDMGGAVRDSHSPTSRAGLDYFLQRFPDATPMNAIQSPPSLFVDGFPPVVPSMN